MTDRIEGVELDSDNLNQYFIKGPGDLLCEKVRDGLRAVSQWSAIFGDSIDSYRRMDYSIRELPALRLYNEAAVKEYDSWFIEGDITADLIFPASLRREETQKFQDTLSHALLQQFRRPTFFAQLCNELPGLNELGKRFDIDKSLGFEFGEEEVVPMTQIKINFRIDLRVWDEYLVSQNLTKDSPFEETLTDLKRMVAEIQGVLDNGDTEVTVPTDQKI